MARTPDQPNHTANEIVALSLLVFGTLVFLSLISYAPGDVPTWFPLSSVSRAGRGTANFIGPFGAIIACTLDSFLGAAAYLFAAALLGFGGVKLLNSQILVSRRLLWFAGFVISGACLAQLLGLGMIDAKPLNLAGEGGWIGKWLGELFFQKMLGIVGAVLVVGLAYVVTLILMTGLHPIELMRRAIALPGLWHERQLAW